MEIYLHPALTSLPSHELQAALDKIRDETGLIDIVTSQGAMLVYDKPALSKENELRLKNYQRRHAMRKQNITNNLEIF